MYAPQLLFQTVQLHRHHLLNTILSILLQALILADRPVLLDNHQLSITRIHGGRCLVASLVVFFLIHQTRRISHHYSTSV